MKKQQKIHIGFTKVLKEAWNNMNWVAVFHIEICALLCLISATLVKSVYSQNIAVEYSVGGATTLISIGLLIGLSSNTNLLNYNKVTKLFFYFQTLSIIFGGIISTVSFFSKEFKGLNDIEKIAVDIVDLIYVITTFSIVLIFIALYYQDKISKTFLKISDYIYFLTGLVALFFKFYFSELQSDENSEFFYSRLGIFLGAIAITFRLVKTTLEIGEIHIKEKPCPYKNKIIPE